VANVADEKKLVQVVVDLFDDGRVALEYIGSLLGTDAVAAKFASNREVSLLKGLPYSSFCFLMRFLQTHKIRLPHTITLTAAPQMGRLGKDPARLIRFYESIGFRVNKGSEDKVHNVPMTGELKTVLHKCGGASKAVQPTDCIVVDTLGLFR